MVQSLRIRPNGHDLIRVGPSGDGGYLLPDDLDGVNYCLSPGVAACSDLEEDMASRGMQVFLADKSVDGPAVKNESFMFIKNFISSQNSEKEGLITMDRWVEEQLPELANDPRCEAVLQMDIEGFEYEVLHNISDDLLKRFRIVDDINLLTIKLAIGLSISLPGSPLSNANGNRPKPVTIAVIKVEVSLSEAPLIAVGKFHAV